ncbi:hypothetical protein HDV04_003086 [Boothiomyces sp. JEL0838]|nr:hypothetical protein HDV04_003086 [Boothiomyces sp. JEL0838]
MATIDANPRGIPRAPFVDNVSAFLDGSDHESTLAKFQEMISKYKFMENHLLQRQVGLETKIPEIEKSLELVVFLASKEANVMLEYPIEEAKQLLESKLGSARISLAQVEEDLEYLKEQITTMEVNMARVYNDDVRQRKVQKNMQVVSQTPAPFKVICLTGGPCGGKTSSVSILSDLFESLGWRVYRVPETATILFGGGVHFPDMEEDQAYSFQKSILAVMIQIENTYRELAKLNSKRGIKTVIICDRGAMDPSAYMKREDWLRMLDELHLAAKGAESFYSLENNATRTEGLELARALDTAVMSAWVGHASLQVIDNVSVQNFMEKCDRVVQAVSTRLGLTADSNRYGKQVKKHKFLVKNFSLGMQFPVQYREFLVEHRYLVNTQGDGTQTRIRRRVEVGTSTVHLNSTIRYPPQNGQRVEIRRNINPREFESLRTQVDPTRVPINKVRRCFLFNDRYYQLDIYKSPSQGLVLLEAYLDYDETGKVMVPEWLDCEDVTDKPGYSMYDLALKENDEMIVCGTGNCEVL